MKSLRSYISLATIILGIELILILFARSPISNPSRLPQTFEDLLSGNTLFTSSLLPDLFGPDEQKQPPLKAGTERPASALVQQFRESGLVNISELDSTIKVDLRYSTSNNFLGKDLYGELNECWLQKETAAKLVRAQQLLKERYPFYSIIIYDGVRPRSIQQTMWDELQVPEKLKDKYVSDPAVGSLHNYGCAVDVSLINENGWEMDMGTPYDYFGELGHPQAEPRMLKEGRLTWRQFENRKLLREIMLQSGFTMITTEWWHFNGSSLKIAGEKYKMIQ